MEVRRGEVGRGKKGELDGALRVGSEREGLQLVGGVNFTTEGSIRKGEGAEVATGKDPEGGQVKGWGDAVM